MWNQAWREDLWNTLDRDWDLVIIGGGVTGAGILRLASASGVRALLLEANDFSSGTSSRSSKLVHGGFRYLYNRQFDVTHESVREREWMLRSARRLVEPMPFILPNYRRYGISSLSFRTGVLIYDLMAPKWAHRSFTGDQTLKMCPGINPDGILDAQRYYDGVVDDSRLVLRLLHEAEREGGKALNYAKVCGLLRQAGGKVCGVRVEDTSSPDRRSAEIKAKVVINATGPWTDDLRAGINAPPRLRKLRGSHLVFSRESFPIENSVTLFHPDDKRAMFVIPWEGVTLVGTTDLDHPRHLEEEYAEPFASEEEIDYLVKATHFLFPGLGIGRNDIQATFAGLRPVVNTGAASPGKESRAHAIWNEDGLLTITGGKLTTFRVMARQVLEQALPMIPGVRANLKQKKLFGGLPEVEALMDLPASAASYLLGRYGMDAAALVLAAREEELQPIDPLPALWAELRWAARSEAVLHLDDILLRRVRLGLLLPRGGLDHVEHIRAIVQPELNWDDTRWAQEVERYSRLWQGFYSPQPGIQIIQPD